MPPISIDQYATKPVEVSLWGSLFEFVLITKRTQAKIRDALAEINRKFEAEADPTKHAAQAKVFAARMDVRLQKATGGKKKASTLIKEKWDSGDLTMPQADQFWEAVEARVEAGITGAAPVEIEAFAGASVDVDLWGTPFEAIRVTALTEPAIDEQLAEVERSFGGRELEAGEMAEALGLRFDARLTPVEGDKKASDIVREKWNAGEVDVPQLQRFWAAVLEEIDRPS
jgi:hypothetical protein